MLACSWIQQVQVRSSLGSSVSRLEIPSFQVFLEPPLQLAYFKIELEPELGCCPLSRSSGSLGTQVQFY
jgi:hypothetical protein